MLQCSCYILTSDDFADAAQNMAAKIINAPNMAEAVVMVFHDTHRPEDNMGRPCCALCTDHIRDTLIELGLRPEFERSAAPGESLKIYNHCLDCDGCDHPHFAL